MKQILLVVLFVLTVLMAHSSASACSDLNGDGVVSVADFLIFVDDFGKTVTCGHAEKVQLIIQNQFNDAVWDTSRNAAGVLTITITKKPPPPPPPPPPVTTPVNTDDRAVLIELYNAMEGDNWRRRSNWLSDRPLNEWYGVSTTEDGRVDSLIVGSINRPFELSGFIPESLGNLTNLVHLQLEGGSKLSGSIPESLGNLTNLKELHLHGTLSGSIPESLSNLTNLEVLNLSSHDLSGPIPESLGNLQNLKELRLVSRYVYVYDPELRQGKGLTGSIPKSLGNLTNLVELNLSWNYLTGSVPESLGNLTNLVNLNLRYNNLSGPIPESLTNLTNLGRYRRGILVLGLWLAAGNRGLCLPVSLYDWAQGLDRKGISDVWDPGLSDCN